RLLPLRELQLVLGGGRDLLAATLLHDLFEQLLAAPDAILEEAEADVVELLELDGPIRAERLDHVEALALELGEDLDRPVRTPPARIELAVREPDRREPIEVLVARAPRLAQRAQDARLAVGLPRLAL